MTNVHTLPVAEHPKAVEAKTRAAIREVEHLKIKKAIAGHKLHFHAVGNYTFCYRVDRRNVLEVASAICHPSDKPDAHQGRVVALERFAAAHRMHLRIPAIYGRMGVRRFLDLTFSE